MDSAAAAADGANEDGGGRRRGHKEGPWTRFFLRLDERQSKTVYLSVCRFCLAAHSDSPATVAPPRKMAARRASQIPHLKRCANVPPGQARADVDALLAAFGKLQVVYAARGSDKDRVAGGGASTPQPAAPARASKREPHASAASTPAPTSSKPSPAPPRSVAAESASAQVVAPTPALPQLPPVAASPLQQYISAPPPRTSMPQAQQDQQPPHQVLSHPPLRAFARPPPPPSPVQQLDQQQSARQFQALVADVGFENGIPPEWVESSTLKRLVRWLRPELERVLPTSDAVRGRLLRQAARGADAAQSDMDAFVKQGARVAVIISAEDADSRDEHGQAALFRVLLASLSASKCVDVRRVHYRDLSPVSQVRSILDRVSAANVRIGSVCLDVPETFAGLRESIARENPQLIVLSCFAHSVNAMASAVFRTPLIRSTLVAVAETIDAILSPPAVIDGAVRAIPWQLAVFSTVFATYGAPLELTRVEAGRWTSAYEAAASVLRVRSALREFATSHFSALQTHPVAHSAVAMLRDDAFWVACKSLETVLRPLAVAARRISSGDFTLAQVASTFMDMTQSLLPAASTGSPRRGQTTELYTQERALLVEIEARWSRCGVQRIALLAYFLHPETRAQALKLRESELTSPARLAESAIACFHALFGASEPTNRLRGDVMKWRNGTLAKDVQPAEFDNWLSFWEYIRECKIAVELARLAIFVLSAGVHTGTCEVLWRRRCFGSRDSSFIARHEPADSSASLAKLKELEMARLAIERQRKADFKAEMERRARTSQGESNGKGVATATELPKLVTQGGVSASMSIDAAAMARASNGSQARTQAELGLMVDLWTGYGKAAHGSDDSSDDSAVVSLSDLVATNSLAETSI